MAIFPVSPTVGQEETVLGRTFVYDGYGWVVKVSGGHIILDPVGDAMPTQPALQFGAGFTVTDEVDKTVVGRVITYTIDFMTQNAYSPDINMYGDGTITAIATNNIDTIKLTYSGGVQVLINPALPNINILAGETLFWEITRTVEGQPAALGIKLELL